MLIFDAGVPLVTISGHKLVDIVFAVNKINEDLESYQEKAYTLISRKFLLIGNGLLLHDKRLVIPNQDNLKTRVI